MGRKEARETVFKLVYERCINGESNRLSYEIYTQNFDADDLSYAEKVYSGIDQNWAFLNTVIEKYSKAFKIERVFKIDLAALLVASYEIFFYDSIPVAVAVNEAVEFSKKYSTEKSYKFINGILSSIIKDKELLIGETSDSL